MVTAAVIAMPAGVAAIVLDGSQPLVLLALVCLVVGAARAARVETVGTPLAHGIVVAVGVFVVVQAFGVIRRSIDPDDTVSWGRIVSNIVLSVLCGTLGGLIGSRLTRGRSGPHGRGDDRRGA
jgi:hypothetical protein